MSLIDIVVVRFDTFVCTLIFETDNAILSPKYNIFESGELYCRDFECPVVCSLGYLRTSYHVYKIGYFLVRGTSLPAAQLFVIAIENILRGWVGNLTRRNTFIVLGGVHFTPPHQKLEVSKGSKFQFTRRKVKLDKRI